MNIDMYVASYCKRVGDTYWCVARYVANHHSDQYCNQWKVRSY